MHKASLVFPKKANGHMSLNGELYHPVAESAARIMLAVRCLDVHANLVCELHLGHHQ